ncbi:lipoprotein-releasing ABC transporter permease subunit [Yoonia sp. 208BN28-4]|uniref:lipoprotein-releasing ABC transporter permease subunit n=1 Tax=Yoonia sp. 208BN28-4 TaxID=3126505 RepID=UPI0030A83BB7
MASTAPFAKFEWMIAWRYIRAKRAEGGVSVMTWISLVGVTLAVFALIATLAVRSGFRAEFVDTILGANAHVAAYRQSEVVAGSGQYTQLISGYDELAEELRAIEGVTRAAPLVRGQVMGNRANANAAVDVYGIAFEDLLTIPRIAQPEESSGDINDFQDGIAIGSGLARELNVSVGDRIKIISPNGARTALGTTPRVNAYDVVYIFTAGRYDIDKIRAYLPIAEAQTFFNRDGVATEIEVFVENPDEIDTYVPRIMEVIGQGGYVWTWRDSAGAFLRALAVEDNVMFVILSILVLIASMNIISGLIMLVKNKGRDIGILRTMGLSEGSILRIFFICGAGIGTIGTIFGVILGCLFAIYIDQIFSFVNYLGGGGVWDPSIRGIYQLPAELRLEDVLKSVALSLGLSWIITIFPARRAARMNPVEALRYE